MGFSAFDLVLSWFPAITAMTLSFPLRDHVGVSAMVDTRKYVLTSSRGV